MCVLNPICFLKNTQSQLTHRKRDNAHEIQKALVHFEKGLLSEETAVDVLSAREDCQYGLTE